MMGLFTNYRFHRAMGCGRLLALLRCRAASPREGPSTPVRGHHLYTAADFTDAEYYGGNKLARLVIDGGLGVCMMCGAGEIELEQFSDCRSYNAHRKAERETVNQNRFERTKP